jgi:large subunit ribosomal protein L10
MNKEEKSVAIDEIAAQIEGSEAIFAVDYRGISVAQAAELRSKLRENDASFRVVKNRLTKLAADKAGEERLADLLQGPTALTFVSGDTAAVAKAIFTFNKEHSILTFKGGFMADLVLDEDKFKSIARLPSRNVLDGQLAGVVASPLTGLVRGLGSMIQGLASQLGQIADQGLVSGEAPAPEDSPADPGSEAEESAADGEAQPSADDDPSDPSSEEAEGPAEDAESPADGTPADAEDAPDPADDKTDDSSEDPAAEASDEVAEDADEGSQGDGAAADDSGSEAEQSSDDTSTADADASDDETSKEEE